MKNLQLSQWDKMYTMTEAFVYCWTDHKTNKLYVGSRKGTRDDGYVCSSKYMMQEYKKRPHDFTRQIVAEGRFDDIRKLEEVILKTVNAKEDDNFYNQHNNDGKFYLKAHTEESKRKIGKAHKGKKCDYNIEKNKKGHSAETREKISQNHHDVFGSNNPMFNRTHKEETKKRISAKKKGVRSYERTEEQKQKMSELKK